MMILFIFGIVLTLLLAQYIWTQRKFYVVSRQLAGSSGWPFLGSALEFFGVSNAKIVDVLKSIANKYPSPFQFWLGPKLFVFTEKPDDIQILLNSPNAHSKGETYELIKKMMGSDSDGLISSTGEKWKYHRKLLNPCFGANILESYVPIFNRKADILKSVVAHQAKIGDVFDIETKIRACTFDMIVDTSLGMQLNSQDNGEVPFAVAADEYMHVMTTRFFNIFLHSEFVFQKTKYYPIVKKAAESMTTFCRDVLTNIMNDTTKSAENEKDAPKTFINQLSKISESAAETFNCEDVIAETITAVLAGHDTTASAISNTLLLLAMHPNIQDKVFAELKGILPDQDSDLTHEHIHKMVYLKQVIKESLRLLVITPVFSRLLTGEVVLSNGVKLPKGCQIAIPVITLHRQKDIWGDDADKFNPDNFAPYVKRHPYSYLPFSGGSRICIGYKYANMAMATVLAQLIRSYTFSTDLKLDELSFNFCITLRLINKHMVRAEKRPW